MRLALAPILAAVLAVSPSVDAQVTSSVTSAVAALESSGRSERPFAVRTDFQVRLHEIERFRGLAAELGSFTVGKETPVSFRFFQNAESPTDFVLLQEWRSVAGFRDHLAQPHTIRFETSIGSLVERPASRRLYRPAEEAAGDGSGPDRDAVERQSAAAPTAAATGRRLADSGMADSPFVLFVDIPVRPGTAATMGDTAARVAPPTLAEPGAIKYGYYQDLADSDAFLLFEHWRRFADMAAHVELPHFRTLMKTFGLIGGEGRQVRIYKPVPF